MITRIEDLPKGQKRLHLDKAGTYVWVSDHYKIIASGSNSGSISLVGVSIYTWRDDLLGTIKKVFTDESYEAFIDKIKEAESYEEVSKIMEDESRNNI